MVFMSAIMLTDYGHPNPAAAKCNSGHHIERCLWELGCMEEAGTCLALIKPVARYLFQPSDSHSLHSYLPLLIVQ